MTSKGQLITLQKEFYFIRHGQTDHNILDEKDKDSVHYGDISLNENGRTQARLIESIVSNLPIKTVCSSPLKRAQETKEIITSKLLLSQYEIGDFRECSCLIWNEMVRQRMYSSIPKDGALRQFMNQIQNGMNQVLSLPGPSLVVAHGGVHWAICCLMSIEMHEWEIDNCVPVHFSIGDNGKWIAKKLL